MLARRYDAATVVEGKARCKAWLQDYAGLERRPDVPLFAQIGRLDPQKGWDLLAEVADRLLARDVQLVVLGVGHAKYHTLLEDLARRHPGRCSAFLGFKDELAHQIEAGADLFLMPSLFEPCGLNQLYSLAHGTVPIVRATGGLADTVVDANPRTLADGTATGFSFIEPTAEALWQTIERALALWPDRDAWVKLMRDGMSADWSWDRSAREYSRLYDEIAPRRLPKPRSPSVPSRSRFGHSARRSGREPLKFAARCSEHITEGDLSFRAGECDDGLRRGEVGRPPPAEGLARCPWPIRAYLGGHIPAARRRALASRPRRSPGPRQRSQLRREGRTMAPVSLALVWHQHQPYYPDDVGGENPMPWVRLHATKDYLGMALHLEEVPEFRCTINLVPSLLAQLEAYVDGATDAAPDPLATAGRRPGPGRRLLHPRQLLHGLPRHDDPAASALSRAVPDAVVVEQLGAGRPSAASARATSATCRSGRTWRGSIPCSSSRTPSWRSSAPRGGITPRTRSTGSWTSSGRCSRG